MSAFKIYILSRDDARLLAFIELPAFHTDLDNERLHDQRTNCVELMLLGGRGIV